MDFLLKKCIGDNSTIFCKKNHYFKKVEDGFLEMNTTDFFNVVQHHQELVRVWCNWVCPREMACDLHVQLEKLNDFAEYVREKNLNETMKINKIGFFYDKDEDKKVFWLTKIVALEKKTVSKRGHFKVEISFFIVFFLNSISD